MVVQGRHDWTSQSTPNKASVQCGSFSVPIAPTINQNVFYVGVYTDKAKTTANPNIPLGQIGCVDLMSMAYRQFLLMAMNRVTVNGVALYGNADATREDAYVNEARTFDRCGGHPDGKGIYHYHDEAGDGCVYSPTQGSHSPLFGVMLDGIPIFGPLGDSGAVPGDLDECNGHTDNAYPFYHYHMAPDAQYPYLVNCLKGCVSKTITLRNNAANMAPACIQATTQYDYTNFYKTMIPSSNSSLIYSCDITTGASIRAAGIDSTPSTTITSKIVSG
ncbi:hypothetical protein HDU67_003362 [Dinochytrium kinnereticum]|nr:hypothetical protein HDU67_003362 [Dinochytrium kinnereticum]